MAKFKPKPAPICEKNGGLCPHFCYEGKQYRYHRIKNEKKADDLQRRLNYYVQELKAGYLTIPKGFSPADILFPLITKRDVRFDTLQEDIESIVKDSSTIKLQPPKLSCFIKEYLENSFSEKQLSTYKVEKIHLRHLARYLQKRRINDPLISDFTTKFFQEYKNFRLSQGLAKNTVSKELSTFRALLTLAVEREYIETNVIVGIKLGKRETPEFRTIAQAKEALKKPNLTEKEIRRIKRFRFLEQHEVEELIDLAKDHWLCPVLVVIAYTGIRRGELMRLSWEDVDIKKKSLIARSKKQSKQKTEVKRSIYMHSRVVDVLKKQKEMAGNSYWVFTSPKGKQLCNDRLRTLNNLLKDTKFEGIGYHCFRHSLGSNLASRGVPVRVIQSILGHVTKEMEERYIHLYGNAQQDAFAMLESQNM